MVGRSRACQEISADCYGVVNARKNGMLGFCIKLISLLLVLGCSTCCHCFHIHCTTLFQAISALASKFNWRSNFSQLHSLLHCTLSSPGHRSALCVYRVASIDSYGRSWAFLVFDALAEKKKQNNYIVLDPPFWSLEKAVCTLTLSATGSGNTAYDSTSYWSIKY